MTTTNNRRAFLGTLGKALGAGGILLPWSGRGAIALPADLGPAAALPVKAAPLPISPEGLRLRELRDVLHRVHMQEHSEDRSREWFRLMTEEYHPTVETIAARSEPTWADCIELAEDIWHKLPKAYSHGEWCGEETGALSTGEHFHAHAHHCRHAIVALVEAVLTLGAGERRDPKTRQGVFPARAAQAREAAVPTCGERIV